MSFLNLKDKTFLIFGVANRKSIAFHIAEGLQKEEAKVVYVVHTESRKDSVHKLLGKDADIYVCDVEKEDEIQTLAKEIGKKHPVLNGLVHSIAYANFSEGMKPFHETTKANFLQTVDVSCFSLVSIANAFKNLLDRNASVIAISISTTEMTAESYGWMAPAKAALNSAVVFLAKSFSRFSRVRFNTICPGLLKTSSSAGIPGYVDNYLYAEKCTLREEALQTEEVANAALFLLSEASSGMNAQHVVLDAGMRVNYFSENIVKSAVKPL